MKNVIITLFVVCVASFSSIENANAQSQNLTGWVVCDNCYSSQQFEAAAIQAHGTKKQVVTYAVGNFISKNFMFVEVKPKYLI